MNINKKLYEYKNLREVKHTVFNPDLAGSINIQLVPSKFKIGKSKPSLVYLNGRDIVPLNSSWTILLSIFIDEINKYKGEEIQDDEYEIIVKDTIKKMNKIFKVKDEDLIKNDLWEIIDYFVDISRKNEINIDIGEVSVADFIKYMNGPSKVTLKLNSTNKDKELSTKDWENVIKTCENNMIPEIVFDGKDPLERGDIKLLIEDGKWFMTKLKTTGELLDRQMAEDLYNASLDQIEIILYSFDKKIHNKLAEKDNFDKVIESINIAKTCGLNVVINIPLKKENKGLEKTLAFIKELGITYINILNDEDTQKDFNDEELFKLLEKVSKYAEEKELELTYVVNNLALDSKIRDLKIQIDEELPCLNNLYIDCNGDVKVVLESVSEEYNLGNILKTKWKKIWKSKKAEEQKKISKEKCLKPSNDKGGKKHE